MRRGNGRRSGVRFRGTDGCLRRSHGAGRRRGTRAAPPALLLAHPSPYTRIGRRSWSLRILIRMGSSSHPSVRETGRRETHKAMLATWIETAAKGRLGGPVRAGMWSTAVIGTHPIQDNQRVRVELSADDLLLGLLPAYWIENKGGNSLWIAPIPPQGVGVRLHYRAIVDSATVRRPQSTYQDTIVRPNLPDRIEGADALVSGAEGAGRQPA